MNSRQDGFTIAEVVISMVMLSIILVTLAGLTYSSAQRAIVVSASSQRQAYAMEAVNRMVTLPFANLSAAAGCQTVGTTNNQFNRCVTVSVTGNQATVTVTTTPIHRPLAGASTVTFRRANNVSTNPLCSGC